MGTITSIGEPRPGPTPIAPTIAKHGYVEEEQVIRGTADLFTYDEAWQPVLDMGAVPFVTRVLVRRPADPAAASGSVVLEPLHPSGDMGAAWGRSRRMLTREGWTWVGVTQDVAGLAATKAGDPERYDELDVPMVGLGFDIVATVASTLRRGDFGSVVLDHLFMTGASYTGTFQRVFLGEGFHERARRPDGGPAVDGYLIQISSGAFMLGGYNPINEATGRPPADHPQRIIQPRDVPVIELLSEGEAETNLASRRDDSDEPSDRYRLYEVPGACHMSRGESSGSMLPATVEEPSTFPMYAVVGGALENLRRWSVEGDPPPRAERIELLADADAAPHGEMAEARPCARDEHGNALGGVRMPELEVPIASYYPHSTLADAGAAAAGRPRGEGRPGRPAMPLGEIMGSMTRFPPEQLRELYGSPAEYVARYRKVADGLVADRWILPADAERMVETAAGVTF
jgi:hypothetical protein